MRRGSDPSLHATGIPQRAGSGTRSSDVVGLVLWHGAEALLSRGEHRWRGLHHVGCGTSDYAGSTLWCAMIKEASGRGNAERYLQLWRDFVMEIWLATMCLLHAWTVQAAVHRRQCDTLLGQRALLPWSRCGSKKAHDIACMER